MYMVNYSIEVTAASAKNRIAPARHAGYNQRRKYMVLERKELKDLDLLDRFLFAEAIEDPETMELILEIILAKTSFSNICLRRKGSREASSGANR